MLCAWPQNITSYELENSGLAVWDLQKRKWSTRKASKPHTSWSIRPDCLLLRWHCVKGPPPWLSRKLERQIYNFVYILYIYIYLYYVYIYTSLINLIHADTVLARYCSPEAWQQMGTGRERTNQILTEVFPSESGQISELHNKLQAILLTNEASQ